MWPRSAEYLYPGLDPRQSNYNEWSLEFYYIRMLERIAECLENWTYMDLDQDRRLAPGVLLFNAYEDPLWSDIGHEYGVSYTEEALKKCLKAQRLFKKFHASRKRGSIGIAEEYFKKAHQIVAELKRPASTLIDKAADRGPDALSEMVDRLCELGKYYLKIQRSQKGNVRARRIAARLLAILDFYDQGRWTVDDPENDRIIRYRKCLAEMFEVIGIQASSYYYAEQALQLPADAEDFFIVRKSLITI